MSSACSRCLILVETVFLLGALAAGLTASISLLLARDEIPDSNCLLYGTFNWTGGAVEGDKPRCDLSLVFQFAVCAVAAVSAVYRCLNIPCEKLDIKCFRVLSIVIYIVCVACVLIECILVYYGVVRFCESMIETNSALPEDSSCEDNQLVYNEQNGTDVDFYGFLKMSTIASWVSLVTWLALTVIACVSMCFRKDEYDA
ncbi:uncharacterized protein LOC119742974 [Patiria miniata]|uniref:Uncharacterized protein n=1 Tax=Patiria miniata TaxID=46514 RepID=A0A914BID4_PATMI|nr:uncharacterized protein LOC119742974 [Patiria miniata]